MGVSVASALREIEYLDLQARGPILLRQLPDPICIRFTGDSRDGISAQLIAHWARLEVPILS